MLFGKKDTIKCFPLLSVFGKTIESIMPSDFIVGQIYKMNPTKYSHVKSPYFVEIIEVEDSFIKTNIPEEHSLKIDWYGSPSNHLYHLARMEFVGMKEEFEHLLLNQKLK